MIPKLDSVHMDNDLAIWETTAGVTGSSFEIKSVDVETSEEETELRRWSQILSSLETGVLARIETRGSEGGRSQSSRAEALERIGYRAYQTILHIQTDRNPFLDLVYRLRHQSNSSNALLNEAFQALAEAGLELTPLSEEATRLLFERSPSTWTLNSRQLLKGDSCVGVVRLFKPTSEPINPMSVAVALTRLPVPFKWTVNFQKRSREATELTLQKQLKQAGGKSKILRLKQDAIEDSLSNTSLGGAELFHYEVLLTLERHSETELSLALADAAAVIRQFGDCLIETVGLGPSFLATFPGIGLHVPLVEVGSTLPLFLPVFRQGSNHADASTSALTLHRRDRSLDQIDLLSRTSQNANALILGSSGRGKSVLLGCLTQSLLNETQVRVIKVDVGGSHSKECELLGGREYRLNLESSQGINPFAVVSGELNEPVRAVLGNFIETLVLDEDETHLPKETKIEIDELLQTASASGKELSIDTLLSFGFSRRRLLSRWGSNGLYGNAFRDSRASCEDVSGHPLLETNRVGSTNNSDRVGAQNHGPVASRNNSDCAGTRMNCGRIGSRLRYFNFQDIFQAGDRDFSRAAMAAVLAVFNLEMQSHPAARLILICDETPFFIENCFPLFKMSTANVRKFGGSVILVAQLSKHLVVNGDTGILENSHHRMLFSADGDLSEFRERFRLRDKDMDFISGLEFRNRRFSEFLYQEGADARVMRLELSPEEYWRITSNPNDRLKLKNLMAVVPGLRLDEAITCLSVGRF